MTITEYRMSDARLTLLTDDRRHRERVVGLRVKHKKHLH